MYTTQCTLHTLHNVHTTLCIVYSVHYTMYTTHYTMYTVYTIHYTVLAAEPHSFAAPVMYILLRIICCILTLLYLTLWTNSRNGSLFLLQNSKYIIFLLLIEFNTRVCVTWCCHSNTCVCHLGSLKYTVE